jgi:D-arginine dehydrogenase
VVERLVPGIRPRWRFAVLEPGCADIDVGALHAAYLRQLRRRGGEVRTDSPLTAARRANGHWVAELSDGPSITAPVLVDAAGAWADSVAEACGVPPLGIAPKRRTMVQLRVGRSGVETLPQVIDAAGTFYFKG